MPEIAAAACIWRDLAPSPEASCSAVGVPERSRMTSLFLGFLLFAHWLTFDGKGKHIVLVSGDDEYRLEQACRNLRASCPSITGLRRRCSLPSIPDGTVNPERKDNIPGLEALKTADLLILFIRFETCPDEQMKYIVDYVEAGKPIIGIRTATHAFEIKPGKTYSTWSWKDKTWDGGFGRQVLGETWVDHHGKHKVQSTRARFAPGRISTRFCGASATARFGCLQTSTRSRTRYLGTACRFCWERCSKAWVRRISPWLDGKTNPNCRCMDYVL